ncbi:hypothetical protein EJ08DRAFT_693547 [Tothia fuscella]|uniref:Uncharacterized protein n=1 Tax=Tothia fuscella TaxID=1048955 RepID=A0A9P4P0L9_9PEZI|nr:hypothetical protein EJ08DRAFT_693547 [Tothia fuscella]
MPRIIKQIQKDIVNWIRKKIFRRRDPPPPPPRIDTIFTDRSEQLRASSRSPEEADMDTFKEVAHPHQSYDDVDSNLVDFGPDTSWSQLADTVPMHPPFPIFQVGHISWIIGVAGTLWDTIALRR